MGMTGGWLEGYTGTPTQPSQGPKYSIFRGQGPTHGQMKAILLVYHEVSQIYPQIDPN